MSVNPSTRPLSPTAQTIAAAPAFDINQFLTTLPKAVPNPTKARQTVPIPAPAQNEPNPHPDIINSPSSILHSPSSSSIDNPVPNSAKARQNPRRCKSNPPRPLTADQLRAVSFLVDGASTNTIAHALCINRHTLSRWKRHPLFQQELRRFIRVPLACR